MDKLRKIGLGVWESKERIVLISMLVILGWRVYKIWHPNPPPPSPDWKVPTAQGEIDVPLPPERPGGMLPPPTSSFVRRNPWWLYGVAPQEGGKQEATLNIALEAIKEWNDGSYRAQIRTKARKWYAEGEKFESFQLMTIDPENKQCEIYSEEQARSITLRLPS